MTFQGNILDTNKYIINIISKESNKERGKPLSNKLKTFEKLVYFLLKSDIIVLRKQERELISMNEIQRTVNQLKELHKQLGILETTTQYNEVRNKMVDIHYYHEKLYNLVSWDEFVKIQEELDEIRIEYREKKNKK